MEELMKIIGESENDSSNMSRAGMFIFFHNVNVQQYSKITFFIFAVFDVRRYVVVNMCINCGFFSH